MAKRKLNRRQRWRIEKIQQERRDRAQRKAERAHPTAADLGEEQEGTVVAHFGGQVLVEAGDGAPARCHFRANLEQLVVGDRVIWQAPRSEGDGVVTAVMPRATVLKRPDNYGNLKPVAANLDRLLVVFAPRPEPSSALLDRYLVAAELSGIPATLVLNKADLVAPDNADTVARLVALYQDLGYPVLQVSATSRDGLADLSDGLTGGTVAFVGQSGVGKSSLVNALLPEAELAVGALSDVSGLGQHTTTTARLFHLEGGGHLIDSPGIREFGLWHIDEDELLRGYRELAALAGHCRFRNCTHRHEPGCALREAADAGRISAERLNNFFHIAATLDEQARQRYHS
ncbi:small ribosomal subunit biogenesis GTPase RsgA [Alcanivorax sp. ZXX171]|nr:small ribosomal subunit biogenesis GTPase RsgA [Alcanivorax sp. ZXX171]